MKIELNRDEEREIDDSVEGFISCLDRIGFTTPEIEDVPIRANVLLNDDDYEYLQNKLKEWSLNEKIRKHK